MTFLTCDSQIELVVIFASDQRCVIYLIAIFIKFENSSVSYIAKFTPQNSSFSENNTLHHYAVIVKIIMQIFIRIIC